MVRRPEKVVVFRVGRCWGEGVGERSPSSQTKLNI